MGGLFANLEQKTDQELLDAVAGMTRDNPVGVAVERLLQVRSGQRQVEAGNALVGVTKQLVNATRLLVVVTALMLLTAAVQVCLMLIR
jgi:hypothetical protein